MPVSDEEVRHARDVVAEIVATHNPKYAPLFDILEVEVRKREQRSQLIRNAISRTDLAKLRELRQRRQKNWKDRGG